MNTKNELKKEIVDMIMQNSGVSFVEIEKAFERHNFLYEGEKGVAFPIDGENSNIFAWGGWNDEAIDIYYEIKNENKSKIELEPCQYFIYVLDGKCLNFPIAKRVRKYKNPHWLPVVFNRKQTIKEKMGNHEERREQ